MEPNNNSKIYFFFMEIVYFKEEKHHYFNSKGERYESVSGLWKPYTKPFKATHIAVKKAFQDLDLKVYNECKRDLGYDHPDLIEELYNRSNVDDEKISEVMQAYIKKWDDKRDLGTAFHAQEEMKDLERGYRLNHFTGKNSKLIKWDITEGWDNQSSPVPLKDLPDGYIPEHLVKSDLFETAGQIDQNFIETIGKTRYIDIDDYKTDTVIETKPSFFHPQKGYAKMYYPFDHIFDTNFWRYALKISTYAYMLELEGFTVRNLAITHTVVNEDLSIKEQTRYKIPYKAFEAKIALDLYKKSLKNLVV